MATVELTAESFPTTVKGDGITFIDFWASWCGPCRQFGPVFEAASEQNSDITFAKVDTEAEQELAAMLQVNAIPRVMAFRDGVLVFDKPGAMPPAGLKEVIDAVRELDMDEVRARMAQRGADSTP